MSSLDSFDLDQPTLTSGKLGQRSRFGECAAAIAFFAAILSATLVSWVLLTWTLGYMFGAW